MQPGDPDVAESVGEAAYAPLHKLQPGPQLLAIYFGSKSCGFCSLPELKGALRGAGMRLRAHAAAAGYTFHFVAVAIDWNVPTGLEYLAELGEFDEISVGGNWQNTSVARYLVSGSPRPGVPTLVLQVRRVVMDTSANPLRFVEEREVGRFVGAMAIADWIRAGASVSGLEPIADPSDVRQPPNVGCS